MNAADRGHTDIVKLLLGANATIDTQNEVDKSYDNFCTIYVTHVLIARAQEEVTALMRAAAKGHTAVVQLLLAARADANLRSVVRCHYAESVRYTLLFSALQIYMLAVVAIAHVSCLPWSLVTVRKHGATESRSQRPCRCRAVASGGECRRQCRGQGRDLLLRVDITSAITVRRQLEYRMVKGCSCSHA
jgi:hypothetical protein